MKNIMKLFLYAALPLALIALGSCSYPKNITFKADSQTGALSGLYLTSDTSMNWILRTDGTQYEWVDSRYGWGLGHLRINGTEYSWNIPTKKHDTSHHMTVKYQTGDIEINVSIRPRACFFPLFSFLPLWLHYNLNPLCVQY